jgi:hypothetical protein
VARSRNIYTSSANPNSLITFHWKRALLWRFNVAGKNKTQLGLRLKRPISSDFNQIWIFSTDFHTSLPVSHFMEMRLAGTALVHADRGTDDETDGRT